jgi:hypothetical protein
MELRRLDGIEPGQKFRVERIDKGEYRLIRLSPPQNHGLLDWLRSCPEKDFFVSIESDPTHKL